MMGKAADNRNAARRLWLAATGLFLASFAVRLYLAWFDKALVVYYDETRYFDIARSLWQQGAVLIQGTPSDFQKLLYPLALSPAFAFGSTAAAMRAIAVLNAALASSVVFPVLLMARRALQSVWGVVLAMALAVILPDLAYSMTFMSETLTLPVTLWAMLLLWQVWQTEGLRRKLLYAALGGVASYLLYLGKELGLAVVIAFVLYSAALLVWDKAARRATLLALGIYLAAFGLCYMLARLTLFRGLGGSYIDTSPDILRSLYTVFYLFYSLLVNTTMTVIAFFYFPLALLCFRCSHLTRPQRDLFLFTVLCLVVSLGAVSYTIYIRDDLGTAMLRQHVRYVSPYFVPLLVLSIGLFEKDLKERFRFKNPTLAYTAVFTCAAAFCGMVAYCVKPTAAALVDHTMLKYYANLFSGPRFAYYNEGLGQVPLYVGVLLFKALIIAAVIGGSILFLRAPKRVLGTVLCACVVGVSLLNNYLCVRHFTEEYKIPTAEAAAADAMNEELAALGGLILVVQDDELDRYENRLLDTYLATPHYTIPAARLRALQGEGDSISLTNTPLNEHLSYVWLYQPVAPFTTVEYLLLHADGPAPAEGSAELVASYIDGRYVLYRLTDSHTLALDFPAKEEPAA